MKKSILLLFSILALQTQAQITKTQAKYSVDSLLPSSSSVRISEVRKAFEKTLNYTQSVLDTKTGFFSLAQIRAFNADKVTANPRIFLADSGKEGEFVYKSGSSAADNTGTVIVTSSGARYERIYTGGIKTSWFLIAGDAHSGLSIRRAVNLAIAKLSTTKSETVIISAGNQILDTCSILMPVPLDKKLTIYGEPGNLIDFYHPNYDLGIFSNAATWTYADSVYTHGTIELNNLNFVGNRNPTPSYLSSNTGVMGFWFHNMQRVEVRNCSFTSWYGSGGFIGVTGGGIIDKNVYYNVYARQPNDPDARGDGITLLAYCKNFFITNNDVKLDNGKAGRGGIVVDNQCENIIVEGNLVQGYERGIHIEASTNISIFTNHVTRSPIAGYSSQNTNVVWQGNTFDGDNRTSNPELAFSAIFWVYLDSASIYRGNTVKNWHGLADTYLAKFWGNDLLVENNTFQPNRNNALIWCYGDYKRNRFVKNRFEGKVDLTVDITSNYTIQENEFFGGYLSAQNSIDTRIIGNTFRPETGENTGQGVVLYGATRPFCVKNVIIDPTSYCFENTSTTNAIFEENTFERFHPSAAAPSYFYVNPSISATGVKKTASDRYNIVNDYNNDQKYYVGNTGTPTAY